jgi:hypothetical protein
MEFFVYNSLNDKLAVKFNITLRYFVLSDSEGDHKWTIEIGTTRLDVNGDEIPPKRINNINVSNLDTVIEEAVADICLLIDWNPLVDDVKSPYISYNSIVDESVVPIDSYIRVRVTDDLLSSGIDLSNTKIILNNSMIDFDITEEVVVDGDPYEFTFIWKPPLIIKKRYDEV